MTIGLIADTHGYLDPQVESYFKSCDEIWHAGDIGNHDILDALNQIKPTYAVYGNIDGHEIRLSCKEDLLLKREGLGILMTHIAGSPGKYNKRVRELIEELKPDLLVCGHSHILKVTKDPKYHQLLYVNPGAAGKQGFHHKKTVMRLYLSRGQVTNLEVIELGKRGTLS